MRDAAVDWKESERVYFVHLDLLDVVVGASGSALKLEHRPCLAAWQCGKHDRPAFTQEQDLQRAFAPLQAKSRSFFFTDDMLTLRFF